MRVSCECECDHLPDDLAQPGVASVCDHDGAFHVDTDANGMCDRVIEARSRARPVPPSRPVGVGKEEEGEEEALLMQPRDRLVQTTRHVAKETLYRRRRSSGHHWDTCCDREGDTNSDRNKDRYRHIDRDRDRDRDREADKYREIHTEIHSKSDRSKLRYSDRDRDRDREQVRVERVRSREGRRREGRRTEDLTPCNLLTTAFIHPPPEHDPPTSRQDQQTQLNQRIRTCSDMRELCEMIVVRGGELDSVNVAAALCQLILAWPDRLSERGVQKALHALEERALLHIRDFNPTTMANTLRIMARQQYTPSKVSALFPTLIISSRTIFGTVLKKRQLIRPAW